MMNEFTRGDTFAFKTPIKFADGTPVEKEDIETLFITVKLQPSEYSPIIFQKKLEDVTIDSKGYCHVIFEPKDTETLFYGTYYFDIEVTLKSGYRKTSLNSFNLTKETTNHGGDTNGS